MPTYQRTLARNDDVVMPPAEARPTLIEALAAEGALVGGAQVPPRVPPMTIRNAPLGRGVTFSRGTRCGGDPLPGGRRSLRACPPVGVDHRHA